MSNRKIRMFISNGNDHNSNLIARLQANVATPSVKPAATSLKNPMISRVHNTKPGCGSCGGKKAY